MKNIKTFKKLSVFFHVIANTRYITLFCYLLLTFFWFSQSNTYAQKKVTGNFKISTIDVSEGLSNNYVTKIIKDPSGFLWIATEGGLNKYDGKSFQVFNSSNTSEIFNENIEVVYKTREGNLWIGTKSGGITYFDIKKEKFININQSVFNENDIRVTNIIEDHDGNIFIGTWNNGLYIFNPFSSELTGRHLIKSRIEGFSSDKYGNIWISEGNNLHKYDPSEERTILVGNYGLVSTLLTDTIRNRLWIGINRKGVAYIDLEDYTFHPTTLYNNDKLIIESMDMNLEGNILVGTWGQGLFISDSSASTFSKFPLLDYNKDVINTSYETILDIYCDHNGIIWVGTALGGILKLMPVNEFLGFRELIPDENIPDNNIYSIYTDAKNRIWFGTYGAGVFLLENKKTRILNNLPVSKVNVFYQLGNYLLIGSREGLFYCDIEHPFSGYREIPFADNNSKVTALLLSSKNRLYIGTQQQNAFYMDIEDFYSFPSKVKPLVNWKGGDRISKIVEDSSGNIWFGTFNGLHVYNQTTNRYLWYEELFEKPLPSKIINDLWINTEENIIWAALSGGLIKIKNKGTEISSVEVKDSKQGLKNEFITSIIEDSEGNLWLGSAFGIAKYIPERNVFENFGDSEGLPVLSFNNKSACLYENMLIFGGNNGITAFQSDLINYQKPDPKVVFSTLNINGQDVGVGEEINGEQILNTGLPYATDLNLNYFHQTISISVSTNDFLGDENVMFSYRLKNFNDNWSIPTSNNEIRYTNLNSGQYILEVKASRDNYNWSEIKSIQLNMKRPPWTTWYAYTFYLLLLLGVSFLIYYHAKKEANLRARLHVEKIAREKEHDLSEAKITFFTNISHEFRTPLTLILSPVTELLSDDSLKGKIKDRLNTVEKNASKLLNLINQLLDFRKSENGLMKLRVAHGDFGAFAHEIYLSFTSQAKSKHIKYKFHFPQSTITMPYDRDKMEIVLVNLLSNAFKYTPKNGTVDFFIHQSGNNCIIDISNTGQQIKEEEMERIFDRFYQIKSADSAKVIGSGIGLSLAKNIIDMHHGKISVRSGGETTNIFSIQMLIDNPEFTESDYIPDFKNSESNKNYDLLLEKVTDDEDEIFNENFDTILVVDDNPDIRNYITSLLCEQNYNVLTAENGMEAIDVINKNQSDLIISDIMMPEMDGITLCSKIKNDMSTSHIPVILLTARTSTVFELNGLQTGADDYIKKPFHPGIVKTRVKSILENRKKLREHFNNKLRFEPSNQIEAPDTEEKFMQDAIAIIEENITNSEFDTEEFTRSLAMSKSTLYRKLKSLTGLSITGFIRSVKLKKAAIYIISKNWKLNHVAIEAGFNDYKYFKKCFLKHFGCLPSEYRKKKKATENNLNIDKLNLH